MVEIAVAELQTWTYWHVLLDRKYQASQDSMREVVMLFSRWVFSVPYFNAQGVKAILITVRVQRTVIIKTGFLVLDVPPQIVVQINT